ncbi:MAG TPA: hypothetical protein VGN12_17060 [Pirellulales bacterium]|jgi:hypothetical protein
MNRAAQFWRNSVQKRLPKDSKQQLYWVAVISCVLLIVVQTHKIMVSRLSSASATTTVEAENTPPPTAVALQEAEHTESVASDPMTVARTERDEPVSTSGASPEPALPPRDEATSSEQSFASSQAQDTNPEAQSAHDSTVTVKQVFAAFGGDPTPAVAVEAQEQVDVGAKKLPLFAIIRREVDRRAGRFRDADARHRAFVVLFGSPAEPVMTSTASSAVDSAAEDSANPQEMPSAELASENVSAERAIPENATADGDTIAAQPSAENSAVVEAERTDGASNARALDQVSAPQVSAPQSDVAGGAQTAEAAELPPAELVIVNPLENGGVVLFLLDGQMFSLSPGESQNWPADHDRSIAFHRGESFGDFRTALHSGRYTFRVGAQGWELVADEQESPR